MKALILTLFLGMPIFAQIERMELRYEDSGCASCAESLEKRIGRMRGVEEVKVNSAEGQILVKLAAANRVAFEQVRDFVEQGGSKVRSARLTVMGRAARGDGGWLLSWEGARDSIALVVKPDWRAGDGPQRVEGTIEDAHPASGRLTLKVD